MKLRNLFLITMFALLSAPMALGDELAVGKTGNAGNTGYPVAPAQQETDETEATGFDALLEYFLALFE